MPTPMPPTGMTDPLAAFMSLRAAGRYPVPLVSTAIEVEIEGGLVVVSTRRVFRNVEPDSIEATLTFPVPVHATLFALEARMEDRLLLARATERGAARDTYERAIDDGRTAVLHEEVLRGVHMLSVAPLAPGAELEVVARWVATLSFVGERGEIRIPMTVGEIYGASPLADADDLVTGGEAGEAELVVRCPDRRIELVGGDLVEGRARVPLDAPVDLVVPEPGRAVLRGVAADGSDVFLRISRCGASDGPLNVAILVDHSGSMDEAMSGVFGYATKHQSVVAALAALAPQLRVEDAVDLWEFDHDLLHIGHTSRPSADGEAAAGTAIRDRFRALVSRLSDPNGGTEIGQAISGVLSGSLAPDLLLITDGKSYALDIHALASMNRRISVLIVGEDSLEANVGHLAALTGGDLFVAMGADFRDALNTALSALRAPGIAATAPGDQHQLRVVRRNALIEAEWQPRQGEVVPDLKRRAAAALAASLRLSSLPESEAAALAEAEGLVTHLTSLVLVDHAGKVQEGVPSTRKVALPAPRTAESPWGSVSRNEVISISHCKLFLEEAEPTFATTRERIRRIEGKALRKLKHPARSRKLRSFLEDIQSGTPRRAPRLQSADRAAGGGGHLSSGNRWDELVSQSEPLEWESVPNRLLAGDLSAVSPAIAKRLLALAAAREVVSAAERLGLDPLLVVIGLLAREHSRASRAAARMVRAIFGATEDAALQDLGQKIRGGGEGT